MEHVDGSSLEREPPVTFATRYICEQVAQGLAEMYKRGLCPRGHEAQQRHRDEQPDGEDHRPGSVAKIGTVKQRIQGTPDYIARAGAPAAITPKTDVYNLGATMYWIFTLPFVPTALTGKSDSLVQGLRRAFILQAQEGERVQPARAGDARAPWSCSASRPTPTTARRWEQGIAERLEPSSAASSPPSRSCRKTARPRRTKLRPEPQAHAAGSGIRHAREPRRRYRFSHNWT